MDDLSKKTDDELRSIMRSSIANQHVSGSIYHKAKQELEFRTEKAKQSNELSPTAKAVLLSISKSKIGTDATGRYMSIEVLEHNFGKKRMPKVNDAITQLVELDFIEEVEGYQGLFKLTPFGDSHLSELGASSSIQYSNISNSNIAHQSQGANQTVNIGELPEDIQRSIEELRIAANERDASGMKKAFAYIADKAVDVAIAIAVGHLKL